MSPLPGDDEDVHRVRLTWPGRERAAAEAASEATARIVWDEPNAASTDRSVAICGDNLEVMKCLRADLHGAVKLIYIDPPYNTGKDFTYRDRFIDDDTGAANPKICRHTAWLNMLFPRLLMARSLLAEEGWIFVSVDDHELHNLRHLLDDVFGEQNFVATIVVQANKRGQTYKSIAKTHEYLVVYRCSEKAELGELRRPTTPRQRIDDEGVFEAWELRNRNPRFGRHNRPNLFFPIYVDPTAIDDSGFARVSLKQTSDRLIEVLPRNRRGEDGCWRWSSERISASGLHRATPTVVARQKRDGGWNIYQKSRKRTTKAKSIWLDDDVINEHGTLRLRALGLAGAFDHPKPIGLIKRCIELTCETGDVVLDFFAGSGSTGDAVMQLNATQGAQLRFILIQSDEKNIFDTLVARLRASQEDWSQQTGSSSRTPKVGEFTTAHLATR